MKKKLLSLILVAAFILGSVFVQPVEMKAASTSLYGSVEEKKGVYYLTDGKNQEGTVTYNKKINTEEGTTITFKYYLKNCKGSDGVANGIQVIFTPDKIKETLLIGKSNAGREGAYAVEFDTCHSGGKDPKYEHIGVIHEDSLNHLNEVKSNKIADGKWHTAKIKVTSEKLVIYVDNKKVLTSEVSLSKNVYLSISASTKNFSYSDQRIKDLVVGEKEKEKLSTPTVTVASTKKNTATVTWKKVKNADKYVVYRADSKRGTLTKVKQTSSLKFTDKKVKGGKTYYYTVLAYDKDEKYLDSALSYIESIKIKK